MWKAGAEHPSTAHPDALIGAPMTTPSPLPGTVVRTLYRGDTREWVDVLEVNTGTDLAPVWAPKDLTGWTWLSQLRASLDDGAALLATIAVTTVTDGTDGKLHSKLTAAAASGLPLGAVFYDLQGTDPDGNVRTFLAGKWKVIGDVSRP